jgi:DNA-binding MurR/RpiR family transcriptional regulator
MFEKGGAGLMAEDILVRLRQSLPGLRPSGQRIARAALSDPAAISGLSITELATRNAISTATVARFCRSVGFDGYKGFCLALTSAAVLPAGAVAIAFSHSGETEEAISALETASRSGALTVAVTSFPESPLAGAADAVLTTASRETRFRCGAMSSRIAQLVIVGVIFVGVAQRHPEKVSESLAATLAAVAGHRRPRRKDGQLTGD